MKLSVYNQTGEKKKDLEVSSRIFGVKVKQEVIHQVVVAQMASSRQVLADTKGKGEVRGGGKKPWKQKGTGRARHGSSRSPIWKGGGVTFGPKSDRNFVLKVNKKQKQLAMAMCLSDKINSEALAIFDNLEFSGKTKELNLWISGLKQKISGLKNGKKFLIIVDKKDNKAVSAVTNLKNVEVISADSLNCIALLKHDVALASEKAVEKIEAHYKQIKEKIKEKKDKD